MILGVGIDLIEVERIRASLENFGGKFLDRILRPEEQTYCLDHKHPAPHVAARFAAKEAISKAFGTGIGIQLNWQDMEICRKETGEPFVRLHGAGLELMKVRKVHTIHLSLSHTVQHATAVAILEG